MQSILLNNPLSRSMKPWQLKKGNLQHLTTSISFPKSLLSIALKTQEHQFAIIELVATGDQIKMLTAEATSFPYQRPLSKERKEKSSTFCC